MAMDLENIMQDTIVIEARFREKKGDRGRSRKWKEMLKLPPVAHCLCLKDEIDHSYEYLVEEQPIGCRLFYMFCERDQTLLQCVKLLEALDNYQLVPEEKALTTAQKIYDEFIAAEVSTRVSCVSREEGDKVKEKLVDSTLSKSVFEACRQSVREFLSGQPFIEYIDSRHYWRYLQWKYLEKTPVTKNSFRVYRVLGKGGFGLVHACQSKPTGKMYALKKLEKKRVKKRKGEKLALNEKQILERVNSRFVVSLAYAYQTKDALCMVLTLMNGGDLRFHIHYIGSSGLAMERVVFYAAEMARGLSHLHAVRIAYRDMKPDNILLDDHGHVRISDLGLAVHIPEGQSVRGRVGTVGYMAPEVIDNHRYTFGPDWWGLGCVVYEMIAGECPFRKRKERVSREVVEKRVREETPTYSSKFSSEAALFVTQLLDRNTSSRLGRSGHGFEDLKSHPFFSTINWKHLDAGVLEPPFVPNPRAVYAKDVLDIDPFSSVKGVDIEEPDHEFAAKFASGAISKPWQDEMIEMKVFNDVNKLYPIEGMTLEANAPQSPSSSADRVSWAKIKSFFKFRRQSSAASDRQSSSTSLDPPTLKDVPTSPLVATPPSNELSLEASSEHVKFPSPGNGTGDAVLPLSPNSSEPARHEPVAHVPGGDGVVSSSLSAQLPTACNTHV